MHDHLTSSTGFWRCLRFKISQGSKYSTVVNARVRQCAWTWLNIAEYPWICLEMPAFARILSIPQYSYNNIITIVTNVVMLEFLSARFIHPGAANISSFFFNKSCNIRKTKASKLLINFCFWLQWAF